MARTRYFDRYERFRQNGTYKVVPLIDIPIYDSDKYITFDKSTMRLDNVSYKYYGNSDYAWLILLANPTLGSLEFLIPDGSSMRIPYPLDTALSRYESNVTKYLEGLP